MGEEQKSMDQIKEATGIVLPLNSVWKAKLLVPVLENIGVEVGLTDKGKPNIDQAVLKGIDHPVADAIGWARKTNKLRTTFAKSIRDHMTTGNRIHCGFNQLARDNEAGSGVKGARWGRMSSEHPNMQQQPARDEFAAMWRSIYVPDEGGVWCSADYSQQEPRVLTHYAELSGCNKADTVGDRYRQDPSMDIYTMMAELTGLGRKAVKSVHLGLCYGMGGAKLANTLGLPTKRIKLSKSQRWIEVAGDEAQEIIDQFNAEVPFVKELAKRAEKQAKRMGFIRTICGRRCRFPVDAHGNFDWCHKALNRLIQGSSADHTKTAMVAADAAGYPLQLQVHDELDLTVESREDGERLGEVMTECIEFKVPMKVDVEIGPSWGEAK